MANMPDVINTASVFDKEENNSIIREYLDVLRRNLAAFGLEIEAVIGDGDCAFRRLAKKIVRVSREDKKCKDDLKAVKGKLNYSTKKVTRFLEGKNLTCKLCLFILIFFLRH